MTRSNDSLALALLVDATAEDAREQGQRVRDSRTEQRRREVAARASRLKDVDRQAVMVAVFLTATVLVPFLIGHFVLTKTFVLEPNPGVYAAEVRGIGDHFLATYLAGLIPIIFLLGIFLVARRPWDGRRLSMVGGCVAIAGSLIVLLPTAQAQWQEAESKTVAKLRETAFPFDERYFDCESWYIHAENGAQQPELWQVHLGRLKGSDVDGCNRVNVYRGWQFVGAYNLPDGDTFTGHIVINHVGWDEPLESDGGTTVYSSNRETGRRIAMNPVGTNIDLETESGRRLEFSLDGAATNGFALK